MHDPPIDHVTIAGSDLHRFQDVFGMYGLEPVYGGVHSNEITHMSQLGFGDGSYLELFSTVEPNTRSPVWGSFVEQNGGPCGWAIVVEDIEETSDQFRDEGISVHGPDRYERETQTGHQIVWDMAVPDENIYPLLIRDRTDRARRALPGMGTKDTELGSITRVILGVEELERQIDTFHALFDLGDPELAKDSQFDLEIANFSDIPVTLVSPTADEWLSERLATFGQAPVSFLLESGDPERSRARFGIDSTSDWGDLTIGWVSVTDQQGIGDLGIVL